MSNRRKNKLIDTFKDHQTGVEIEIYLTPDNRFQAQYMQGNVTRDNIGDLKNALADLVRKNAQMEWHAVLEIEEYKPWTQATESPIIGFDVERYYLAQKADGTYLKHEWLEEGEQIDPNWAHQMYLRGVKKIELPYTYTNEGRTTYMLKYDEDTWTGLQELQRVIEQLRDHLKGLIGSDEGRARVSQVGATLLKALPAPKDAEE